jgi:hypothetical protein
VAVGVVDPLEVVEVEQRRRQRREVTSRLGHHALDGVLDGPVVGQPGEGVGGGRDLGDGLGGEDVVAVEILGPGVDRAEASHRHPRHHHRGRQQPGQGQHQFLTDS